MINQRRKGHQFERDCVNYLKKEGLDTTAKRHLEYQMQEAGGRDIDTMLPLCIQCKAGSSLAQGIKGWKQADEEKSPGEWPVCFLRYTNKGEFAVLNLEDFLEIFGLYWRECVSKGG